jgi:predicted outer membrane repeat protein
MRKIFLFLFICCIVSTATAQIYVVETSSGAHNGTSWADAYTDLQTAIYEADAGDTIWVAQGIYKPFIDTLGNLPPLPTSRSFWLKNGVVIYGGFNGTETSLGQRDPVNLKATMEGEITPGVFAEHVLHVYGTIDSTAILDGFIVQNGKSTDTSAEKNGSGVMLRGSAGFYNMVFKDNESYNQGGAIYAQNSSSLFVRCRFESNTVLSYDGGACNFVYSDIKMYNCIFDGNQAARFGGAITTVESNLLVQNGTFFANSGGTNMFQFSTSGTIDLKNCIFHSNSAPLVMGTSGATANFLDGLMPQDNNWLILCPTCIAATPTYTNIGAGDYSLAAGSRGIDEALTATPVNDYADYAGNPRLSGTSMDMGAFEYQGTTSISPPTATALPTVYPNPTQNELTIQSIEPIETIIITNAAGQVLQTEMTPYFSVAPLPAGLYFLQIKTAQRVSTARFVKK